jgi:hypothetical protein
MLQSDQAVFFVLREAVQENERFVFAIVAQEQV